MRITDITCDAESMRILKSMTDSQLEKLRCDPFTFNNWVHQRVGIFTTAGTFLLINKLHTIDYFGMDEEISAFEIVSVEEKNVVSGLEDTVQIDIPFGANIKQINIVYERQIMEENGTDICELNLVRAFVLILEDGREVAFEKTDEFSEEIAISRGHGLTENLIRNSETTEEWEEHAQMRTSRFVKLIKCSE